MSRPVVFALTLFAVLAWTLANDINPSTFPKFERLIGICVVFSTAALMALVFGERK
jgi:hypothetical protein